MNKPPPRTHQRNHNATQPQRNATTTQRNHNATQPTPQQAAAEEQGDGDDHKSSSQFLTHLKKKTEANSEFSRNKTIAQQRRSLPVYQVRDELLQVCFVWGVGGCKGDGVGWGCLCCYASQRQLLDPYCCTHPITHHTPIHPPNHPPIHTHPTIRSSERTLWSSWWVRPAAARPRR